MQLLRKFWAGMEAETQGRGLGQILQDLRTKAKKVGDEMTLGFLFFKIDLTSGSFVSSCKFKIFFLVVKVIVL